MNDKALRFRIGLFVLSALILLAVLVTWFTGTPTLFTPFNRYAVLFDDAPGISPGTPVRRSGVRIGEVESVALDDESGKVRVGVLVEKKYTLRQNDLPTITHGILGGDTTIDLVPRRLDPPPEQRAQVAPGTELVGGRQADVRVLLNQAADVMPTTKETLDEVRRAARRFDQMSPELEEAIREFRALAKATREVIPELRRTNDEIRLLAQASRETVPELRKTNDEILVTARNWGRVGERLDVLLATNDEKLVKTLDNFNETLVRIGQVFNDDNQRNLTATLKNVRVASDDLGSLTKNTDALMKESRDTVKHVNESLTKADAVLANMQQATKPLAERSERIVRNLDESTDQLAKTLAEVRQLLRTVGNADGSLQKLMADPSLYNNLNDVTCMVARILPRVDRALRDLETFADKIARHPELLGVSGVVRPSAGLKESQ